MNTRPCIATLAILLLAGCPRAETPADGEPDIADPTVPIQGATLPPEAENGDDRLPPITVFLPALDVPSGVPMPDDFIIVSEVPGPGTRFVTAEVDVDPRALMADFNRQLAESGLRHTPLQERPQRDGRFAAVGQVLTERGLVRIGIQDYGPDQGRVPGATGAVNYLVPYGN